MSRLWHFWIVFLLYFHQYLHIYSLSSSSSSLFISDLFEKWSQEHGKSYSSDQEKQYRVKVFEENYDYITQHNSKANSSYTLSLNAFADLTHSEFKAEYLLERRRPSASSTFLDAVTAASKPVSINICGSNRAFQFYSKGIFTGPCCNNLDHEVLIMGYDSRNGVGYLNVKNSWGIKKWGINGYMQLAMWNGKSCRKNNMEVIMNYLVETSSNISRYNLLSQSPTPPYYSPRGTDCFPFTCHRAICCCYKRYKFVCAEYGCCDPTHPVCCKVNRNCCSQNAPICFAGKPDLCFRGSGNATLAIQSIGGLYAMLGN